MIAANELTKKCLEKKHLARSEIKKTIKNVFKVVKHIEQQLEMHRSYKSVT